MQLRSVRILGAIFLLSMSVGGPVRAAVNHVDVNGDGVTDQQNIMDAVHALAAKGVTFNDEDPGGHRPVYRNGYYQMCCIDLILVAYRAAGYDLCTAVGGGNLIRASTDYLGYSGGAGGARSVKAMTAYTRGSPVWKYEDLSGVDPLSSSWIPAEPFQKGEMVFIDYTCTHGRQNSDRHSGIVTEVDARSGRPTRISQISTYNKNEGLQEVSLPALFNMYCRRLTGRARPAAWGVPDRDTTPVAEIKPAAKSTTKATSIARSTKTTKETKVSSRPSKPSRSSKRRMVSTNAPKRAKRERDRAGD